MSTCSVSFPDTQYLPVVMPEASNLSQQLSSINSPVLFGCRTGICGTCLVEIEQGLELLDAVSDDEREVLEVYAPNNPKARLACQIRLTNNIALKKLNQA